MTRKNTNYLHDITFKLGDQEKNVSGIATSYTFEIPSSWYSEIPNSKSGTMVTSVTTKNGSTVIGNIYTNKSTVYVPTGNPTFAYYYTNNGMPSNTTEFFKSLSKVKINVSKPVATYGAKIKTYKIQCGTYSSSTSTLLTGYLTTAETIKASVTVTDTRGRSTTKSWTITVRDYTYPKINAVNIYRSNANGTVNSSSGVHITTKVQYSGSTGITYNKVTGGTGTNALTCTYTIKTSTGTGIVSNRTVSNNTLSVYSTNININTIYNVTVKVIDSFGKYVTRTYTVPSVVRSINISGDGKHIAMGGMVQTNKSETVQIYGSTYMSGNASISGNTSVSGSLTVKGKNVHSKANLEIQTGAYLFEGPMNAGEVYTGYITYNEKFSGKPCITCSPYTFHPDRTHTGIADNEVSGFSLKLCCDVDVNSGIYVFWQSIKIS